MKYINDEENFIYHLTRMGVDKDLSKKVYFEAHSAYGGPIKNVQYIALVIQG